MKITLHFNFQTFGRLLLLNAADGSVIREVIINPAPHSGYNIRASFNNDGKGYHPTIISFVYNSYKITNQFYIGTMIIKIIRIGANNYQFWYFKIIDNSMQWSSLGNLRYPSDFKHLGDNYGNFIF